MIEYTVKPELAAELFPIARKALEEAAVDPGSPLAQGALEQARQQIESRVAEARRVDVLGRLEELRQDLNLLPHDALVDLIHVVLSSRQNAVIEGVIERAKLLIVPAEVLYIPSKRIEVNLPPLSEVMAVESKQQKIKSKPVRKRGKRKAWR